MLAHKYIEMKDNVYTSWTFESYTSCMRNWHPLHRQQPQHLTDEIITFILAVLFAYTNTLIPRTLVCTSTCLCICMRFVTTANVRRNKSKCIVIKCNMQCWHSLSFHGVPSRALVWQTACFRSNIAATNVYA